MAALDSASPGQPPGGGKGELEDELLGPPPQPKVSPYYSVARQRARQQIRNARSCTDMGLRAERLAAALEAAESVGLPEPALQSVQEELQSAEGAARVIVERPPAGAAPRPRPGSSTPLRPVTPLALDGLAGSVPVAPGTVALLLLRDDGTAEVRDAYNPCAQTALECSAFDAKSMNLASSFTVLRQPDHAHSRDVFDHSAMHDLLDDCGPFRAVVAVVDPLRPGGQVLCSHFLSHGPQGALCGVIAAVPSTETPAPFAGPAYAALSVLLCLGGESLGLGGRGWAGGGVFGRRLAMVDRAAAYVGGWPSAEVGRLAFKVVEAAAATRAPGGTAGSFLFGPPSSSPEELARASAVRAWLQGATQASHTSQAWIEHFKTAGVAEGEHNDGPMWLHTAEKTGRWPGTPALAADEAAAEGDENEEAADEAADDAQAEEGAENPEGDAEGAENTPAPEEAAEAQEILECGPPKELPAPPPLVGVPPTKLAVPFGAGAAELLGSVSSGRKCEGFTSLPGGAGPEKVEGGLPRGVEVLVVLDLAYPQVLSWPSSVWASWASACKDAGGVLAAAALLPASDAPGAEWHALLPCLHALIQHFNLVVWLQHKAAPPAHLSNALTALLDPSVHISLLAAHLVPYGRLHFCTAFCGASAQVLAADLTAGSCAALGDDDPGDAGPGSCQALQEALAAAGREPSEAAEAGEAVRSLLSELEGHCGVNGRIDDRRGSAGGETVAEAPNGEDGEPQAEGGDEAADGEAEGEAEDEGGPGEEEAAGEEAEGEAAAPGGDAGAPASAPPTQRGLSVQTARLLSFVVGGIGAAASLEEALSLEGEQLQGKRGQPSMAYPISAYGYGCVPLRPWGVSWACPREEVVVFAVHTRAIAAIMRRIVAGLDSEAAVAHGN